MTDQTPEQAAQDHQLGDHAPCQWCRGQGESWRPEFQRYAPCDGCNGSGNQQVTNTRDDSGLRDRIAEVVAASGGRYDGADSDTIADAVMGAVGPEIEQWRKGLNRVRRGIVARAEAAEAENARLKRDLDAAVRFEIGPVTIVPLGPQQWQWRCLWRVASHITGESHPDRAAALARARQIAGEPS